jgi:transcriptional regulator with XRE-family HTH domain
VADAQLTGELVAYHRKRLGLSQVEFAGLIGRSDSWVSQVERGVRAIDRMSVLQKVADVLGVSVDELRGGESADSAVAAERPGAFEALRLALTGHPAIGTALAGETQALTRERLDELRELHRRVWPMVHSSRYNDLAPIVANLIPGLEQAVRTADDPDLAESAREILSDTYQAVSAMMGKLGELDAAWIAADRAAFVAEAQHRPLALAASLFRMAHVFLSLGQVTQAQVVAQAAAESLKERTATDTAPEVLSLWGAFHLVLAIAAARDNDRPQAHKHLQHAREIADRLSEDRNDFGTEFGPTNVALHAVGVAVELGDAGEALDLAHDIEPERLSAERQARYLLDVAQAHAMRRQIGEAFHCLEQAERLTPEQVRSHRVARAVTRDLIQLSGTRPRPELRELAERFGVVP